MKSATDDEPSAETLSVVNIAAENIPPSSRSSPDGSPQQRCSALPTTRLTGSDVHFDIPSRKVFMINYRKILRQKLILILGIL